MSDIKELKKLAATNRRGASELKALLGTPGYLEVDFTLMPYGAILATPEKDGRSIMIATLPKEFRVGKIEAEKLLHEFVQEGRTESFNIDEVKTIIGCA